MHHWDGAYAISVPVLCFGWFCIQVADMKWVLLVSLPGCAAGVAGVATRVAIFVANSATPVTTG